MKLLFKFLKPHKNWIFLALLLSAINISFSLMEPYISKNILDKYLLQYKNFTSSEFFKGIGILLLAAIGVAMISRIAKNFQDYIVNVVIQKSGAEIFVQGMKKTLDLPYAIFEDRRSGETLNILQKVRTDSEKLINLSINLIFTSLIGIIFVFSMSFSVHWLLAPIFLVAMTIVGISSSLLTKKIKVVQKDIVKETSTLAGTTTESLRNIELVKSLGLVFQELFRIRKNTNSILKLELFKVKKIRTLSFVQGTTVNFIRTCLLFFLTWMIFTSKISIGSYYQFMFYTFFLFNPLQELGSYIQAYREAQVSFENYGNLMKLENEPSPTNPVPVGKLQQIALRNVSFKHNTANRNALSNISVNLNKDETVAFVGPSGSGKSTLVKILVGLYEPKEGHVLYNGNDISEIDKSEIRNQLGLVSQESQLFSGTLRDNLQFVKPNATDDEMLQMLHLAAAESLLARAEKGLDTQIGEGGIKVSGGEKQRISIARALLKNPNLLIFDEATSALDSLTEAEITKTLHAVSNQKNRITVIIAHRLSTIIHADMIYVLEKGKIIEQGNHDSLLEEKGLYYAMWRQQIGEVELMD